jgi:MSHA biogenesis protein MshM
MYLQHFGLKEFPFSITPDTDFFFFSSSSQEAFNTLLVAIKTGEGFIKITGEVGTGKTTLCRKLIGSLGSSFIVAYIPNPLLSAEGLLLDLSSELGIPSADSSSQTDQRTLIQRIGKKLIDLNTSDKRVVVCIDEAQAMPIETMETLRLLSNLETEKRKLLQVVIFGQPELEEKLNAPRIRQLKQRITFDYCLSPLRPLELSFYLHHRLGIAGYRGGPIFSRASLFLMEKLTQRVPRLVNIVAHKALLSAFGKGRRHVTGMDVLAAARDTAALRGRQQMVTAVGFVLVAILMSAAVIFYF